MQTFQHSVSLCQYELTIKKKKINYSVLGMLKKVCQFVQVYPLEDLCSENILYVMENK